MDIQTVAHPELLTKIVAFCDQFGMTETRFGKLAIRDPNLIRDIKAGRELRRSTVLKIRSAMENPPVPKASAAAG